MRSRNWTRTCMLIVAALALLLGAPGSASAGKQASLEQRFMKLSRPVVRAHRRAAKGVARQGAAALRGISRSLKRKELTGIKGVDALRTELAGFITDLAGVNRDAVLGLADVRDAVATEFDAASPEAAFGDRAIALHMLQRGSLGAHDDQVLDLQLGAARVYGKFMTREVRRVQKRIAKAGRLVTFGSSVAWGSRAYTATLSPLTNPRWSLLLVVCDAPDNSSDPIGGRVTAVLLGDDDSTGSDSAKRSSLSVAVHVTHASGTELESETADAEFELSDVPPGWCAIEARRSASEGGQADALLPIQLGYLAFPTDGASPIRKLLARFDADTRSTQRQLRSDLDALQIASANGIDAATADLLSGASDSDTATDSYVDVRAELSLSSEKFAHSAYVDLARRVFEIQSSGESEARNATANAFSNKAMCCAFVKPTYKELKTLPQANVFRSARRLVKTTSADGTLLTEATIHGVSLVAPGDREFAVYAAFVETLLPTTLPPPRDGILRVWGFCRGVAKALVVLPPGVHPEDFLAYFDDRVVQMPQSNDTSKWSSTLIELENAQPGFHEFRLINPHRGSTDELKFYFEVPKWDPEDRLNGIDVSKPTAVTGIYNELSDVAPQCRDEPPVPAGKLATTPFILATSQGAYNPDLFPIPSGRNYYGVQMIADATGAAALMYGPFGIDLQTIDLNCNAQQIGLGNPPPVTDCSAKGDDPTSALAGFVSSASVGFVGPVPEGYLYFISGSLISHPAGLTGQALTIYGRKGSNQAFVATTHGEIYEVFGSVAKVDLDLGVEPSNVKLRSFGDADVFFLTNQSSDKVHILRANDTGVTELSSVAVGDGPFSLDVRDVGDGTLVAGLPCENDDTYWMVRVDKTTGQVLASQGYPIPGGYLGPVSLLWLPDGRIAVSCRKSALVVTFTPQIPTQ